MNKRIMILISSNLMALVALVLVNCGDSQIKWDALPQVQAVSFNGEKELLVIAREQLLHTDDGGSSWKEVPSPIVGISKASFINSNQGWLINNDGEVYRTTDAGRTWQKISQLINQQSLFYTPQQIQFVDETHGWISETYSIWRTEDGGLNWDLCFTSKRGGPSQPGSASFIDARNGWVCADKELYHSDDGGKTWHRQPLPVETTCSDVFFVDERTGWASVRPSGGIYRTDDGGQNWQHQLGPTEDNNFGIDSLYFLNRENGWAVGRVWPKSIGKEATRGIVFQTENGGKSWQTIEVGEDETFYSEIHFSDAHNGWTFARDKIYRTQDGGATWRTILSLPPVKAGS